MAEQPPRSRAARDAAERALVRVVHHYPDADQTELRTDAVLAVQAFHAGLFS
jgi:hypothetical protein